MSVDHGSDEAALEPDLPIVDAHHHLWSENEGLAHYARDYLVADLIADFAGHNVIATVYVESQSGFRPDGPEQLRPVGETEFAVSAAGRVDGVEICAAIVGYADMMLGEALGPVLDAHIEVGRGRFRGVRNIQVFSDDPGLPTRYSTRPAGLLLEPQVRLGARELARRDLVFDTWLFHPQLAELCDFADALPDLTIVLNHIGGYLAIGRQARTSSEAHAAWRKALAEVAQRPNVRLKIGGMGMGVISPDFVAAPDKPSSEQMARAWKPLFETAVELFGAERCMLESNFPVDGLAGSYVRLWNAFKRLANGASEAEKAALFSETASRVYNIDIGRAQSRLSDQ
jgi:predicted TIM-barrel fold metal-dependent hydrolase